MIPKVVAVVGDRVAAFELGIVCQVFGLDRSDDGLPLHDFTLCTPRPGTIPTTSGYAIQVEHGLERLIDANLITVPAWPQLDAPVPAPLSAALREAVARGGPGSAAPTPCATTSPPAAASPPPPTVAPSATARNRPPARAHRLPPHLRHGWRACRSPSGEGEVGREESRDWGFGARPPGWQEFPVTGQCCHSS
ncbi:hypothetical protein [Streptosporangium sp. NPDC000509]|uniref:hypothetical protein n=1 Tax=Streptosporangium sp. NPDC000509 TaxID=3366186 RepID=UPI0036A0D79A